MQLLKQNTIAFLFCFWHCHLMLLPHLMECMYIYILVIPDKISTMPLKEVTMTSIDLFCRLQSKEYPPWNMTFHGKSFFFFSCCSSCVISLVISYINCNEWNFSSLCMGARFYASTQAHSPHPCKGIEFTSLSTWNWPI